MALRLHACSTAPELHSSTSARLHACSALQNSSILPRRYTYSEPPELYASTSTRMQLALKLYSSLPPCLHACRIHLEFHTSMIPRLNVCKIPSAPHFYTSNLHAPGTPNSLHPYFRICTVVAHLKSFRAPYSTLPHHYARSLQTSEVLCLHDYNAPTVLHTSRPSCLHVYSPTTRLDHSKPAYFHIYMPTTHIQCSILEYL